MKLTGSDLQIATIRNGQTTANLLGVIYQQGEQLIHFASMVGPKGSLKSIVASMSAKKLKRNARIDIQEPYQYRSVPDTGYDSWRQGVYGSNWASAYGYQGATGIKSYWSNIPNSSWAHVIVTPEEVRNHRIMYVADPKYLEIINTYSSRSYKMVDDERFALVEAAKQDVLPLQLVDGLNSMSDVPVLSAWAKELMRHGQEHYWIEDLEAHGEALVAMKWDAGLMQLLSALNEVAN